MKTMLEDHRPIERIVWTDDSGFTVGNQGVEKIEVYCEVNDVPWFAVYRKGAISSRINSAYVDTVAYEKEEATDDQAG